MECKDKNCTEHGKMTVHGREFTGRVVSAKMQRTVTVEWPRRKYVPKYERYETRRSRVKAHNPQCIDAKSGDTVLIKECRPISKTKNFVIIKKVEQKTTEAQ